MRKLYIKNNVVAKNILELCGIGFGSFKTI